MGFSRQEYWSGLSCPPPQESLEAVSLPTEPTWEEVTWKSLSRVRLFEVHGLYSPWDSPGQNTGVGSRSLLQGILPTQGLNSGLSHCRPILYQLSHQGSPRILDRVAYPFSSGSSQPRNWTGVSCIAGRFLPAELPGKPCLRSPC